MSTHFSSNGCIRIFFPWIGALSFAELYERLLVPADKRVEWSFRKAFYYSLPILWAMSVIMKAFFLPYAKSEYDWIFGYSRESLGIIGKSAWMATGFALTEVITVRVWLTVVNHRKVPSYKLLLHQLSEQQPDKYRVFLFSSKLACWSIAVFAAFLFVWLHFISLQQFIQSRDLKSIFMCIMWIAVSLIAPFYAGPDVATLFVLAMACYYMIYDEARQMIDSLSDTRQINRPFVRMYCHILHMIQQLSPLSSLLMLIGDILIIPTYSVVLYSLNIGGDVNHSTLKVILFTIGTVYAVRAYVLTAAFSVLESQSRRLHSLICSIVARDCTLEEETESLITRHILQDLGGLKKHMCIREYGVYNVDQMDLLNNVLSTCQLILLIFHFKNTLTL